MTNHASPLVVASDGRTIGRSDDIVYGSSGRSVRPGFVFATGQHEGTADRIAACVNACAPFGPVQRALAGIMAALDKRDPGEMHQALVRAASDAREALRALGG